MIHNTNILTETVLTLKEVEEQTGNHRNTIKRWIHNGLQGVFLEVCRQGGQYRTSKEALKRFFRGIDKAKHPSEPVAIKQTQERKIEKTLPPDIFDKFEVLLSLRAKTIK